MYRIFNKIKTNFIKNPNSLGIPVVWWGIIRSNFIGTGIKRSRRGDKVSAQGTKARNITVQCVIPQHPKSTPSCELYFFHQS